MTIGLYGAVAHSMNFLEDSLGLLSVDTLTVAPPAVVLGREEFSDLNKAKRGFGLLA